MNYMIGFCKKQDKIVILFSKKYKIVELISFFLTCP